MKILFNNLKNLLSEKLSVEQRGLLITLLLCKDVSEKITLAKFKIFVNITKYRADLIYLHENRYIKWSGYNRAVKEEEKSKFNPAVHEAIKFMNALYNRNFDPKKDSSSSDLRNRLEDYTLEQIKLVIANRYEEWKNDPKMCKHLNPTTIFRKKLFEKYLEEALRTGQGSGIVTAENIDLKQGDEINIGNIGNFSNGDLYTFKTYQTDSNGKAKGNGSIDTKTGKYLTKMVNVQNNLKKMTGTPTNIYTFVKR